MKTPFEYDHDKALELCKQYSDNPSLLEKVIEKIKITVGAMTVIPSPWRHDYKALHMFVTVNDFTFPFHASHNDAQAMEGITWQNFKNKEKVIKARKDFKNGLLYSLLCCIKSDLSLMYSEPEDLGLDSDSISDMAGWNESKEHARKLSQALRLTSEELESLPS